MTTNIEKKITPLKCKIAKLNESIDDIVNFFLDKYLIEILLIIEHHFPNGVLENYRFEEFCNYH